MKVTMSKKKNLTIKSIEENYSLLIEGNIESVRDDIEKERRNIEEKVYHKHIEKLKEQIEEIQNFIDEGGPEKRIEELQKKIADLERKAEESKDVSLRKFVVIVDFWANWCGPCRMLDKPIKELMNKYDGKLKVVKVNTDTDVGDKLYAKYAKPFGVNAIPYLLIFDVDGNLSERIVGFVPNELENKVAKIIS
jgi:thioredoxin 1